MKSRIKEWLSIQLAKNPGRVVLAAILFANVLFLAISALVISSLSLEATRDMGFWEAIFYTITMILDAGCIQFVISDVGTAGVTVVIVCLIVIVIGMVTFTGAVIGYLTNYISDFIAHANSGARKLEISDHTIVLNWNTRAAEIINDMLYCEEPQKVVVLVSGDKDLVEKQIHESISDTVTRENLALLDECKHMSFFKRMLYVKKHSLEKNLTVMVREGDTYSTKQLRDISIDKAKAIIILGNDINNTVCKFDYQEKMKNHEKGNSQTIKTLIQVAELTGLETSYDNQKIIVEIDDDWTMELVNKIILAKQVKGKCNITPVRVNKILGQILSQFSLMPELNVVYKELFSNKGMAFYSVERKEKDIEENKEYLKTHSHAIPLTCMDDGETSHYYYATGSEKHIAKQEPPAASDYTVSLNKNFKMARKSILILGHNSKCRDIMEGFDSFRQEWNCEDGSEIIQIVVIDDKKNLEKMNYYKEYPYVIKTVEADIYDKDIIIKEINSFVDEHEEDTSILILSDDTVLNEDIDAAALANLIYVQDMVRERKEKNPLFDPESIDIVVEILNPKNHDIVTSYSINNVVISNRYISKMITQIGEKESMFDFYNDILTYDSADAVINDSKEIYIKTVQEFFTEIPKQCTAEELIRAVYNDSITDNTETVEHMSLVLGYVKPGGILKLFTGNQKKIPVSLEAKDKLIIFSDH